MATPAAGMNVRSGVVQEGAADNLVVAGSLAAGIRPEVGIRLVGIQVVE